MLEKYNNLNKINVSLFILIVVMVLEVTRGNVLVKIKETIGEHTNFMKVLEIYSDDLKEVFKLDDSSTVSTRVVDLKEGEKYVFSAQEVYSDVNGVVVKIGKGEAYEVIVLGVDGNYYKYNNISKLNTNIYNYVEMESKIGTSKNGHYYLIVN